MKIISGIYKGKKLAIPNKDFRPTQGKVREALFNIIDVKEKKFLDICAGSGSIGYEALSRGASSVFLIDIDREPIKALLESARILNVSDNVKIKRIAGTDFIKRTDETFDIIYFDPPYNSDIYETVIVGILEKKLLKENGVLVVEMDEKMYNKSKYLENIEHEKRRYGSTYLLIFR